MSRLGVLGILHQEGEIQMAMTRVEVGKEVGVARIPRGWLATDLGASRSKACLITYMQTGIL